MTNAKPYAHEKSAEQYGKYVGDPIVAGTVRAIGEVGQFFYYTGDDLFSLVTTGKHGDYQPYRVKHENGGLLDSIDDIQNVINGANSNFNHYRPNENK